MDAIINSERSVKESEASLILGMSVAWLQKKRWQGGGPPYSKLGKSVVYSVSDLMEYKRANSQLSTSQNSR